MMNENKSKLDRFEFFLFFIVCFLLSFFSMVSIDFDPCSFIFDTSERCYIIRNGAFAQNGVLNFLLFCNLFLLLLFI